MGYNRAAYVGPIGAADKRNLRTVRRKARLGCASSSTQRRGHLVRILTSDARKSFTAGWIGGSFAAPGNDIYFMEAKPDMNGVLCKVAWDGSGLTRTSAIIPMIHSYWVDPGRNSQDHFTGSPDGRYVAYQAQTVVGANIGMIENVR